MWKEAFIGALCSALPEANGIQMWPSTQVTAAIYGDRKRENVCVRVCLRFSTISDLISVHINMLENAYHVTIHVQANRLLYLVAENTANDFLLLLPFSLPTLYLLVFLLSNYSYQS